MFFGGRLPPQLRVSGSERKYNAGVFFFKERIAFEMLQQQYITNVVFDWFQLRHKLRL